MKKILFFLILLLFAQCNKNSIRGNIPIDYILIHEKILIDSIEREYVLFKPKQIKANAILIGLHGRGGTGEELMWKTEFNRLAEEEGFIIVYPSGINRAWIDGRKLPEEDPNANDEKFILSLREKLEKEFSIPKFFLFGYSNGGFMTQKVAYTYPEAFNGYASVVSTISENLNKEKPKKQVPVLFINGTEDPIVPYKGGMISGNKGVAVGAEEAVKQWVKWNKCGVKPDAEIINQQPDGVKAFIHNYTNCKSGKPVRFIKLEGAGHGWPGKLEEEKPGFGKFTTEISANLEIWKFFQSLPRKN
jgi:polyhydroxybutyrate depolymerase